MTTAEKRKYVEQHRKWKLARLYELLETSAYRSIDEFLQPVSDPIFLQYAVTLLCDELVAKDNEKANENDYDLNEITPEEEEINRDSTL